MTEITGNQKDVDQVKALLVRAQHIVDEAGDIEESAPRCKLFITAAIYVATETLRKGTKQAAIRAGVPHLTQDGGVDFEALLMQEAVKMVQAELAGTAAAIFVIGQFTKRGII